MISELGRQIAKTMQENKEKKLQVASSEFFMET